MTLNLYIQTDLLKLYPPPRKNIIILTTNKNLASPLLATRIEGDPKAPPSIATTLRYRRGCYSFPRISPLYPWSLPYNAEGYAGGIKYHFLNLWYDSTWEWTQVFRAIGEHSKHYANVRGGSPLSGVLPCLYQEFLESQPFKHILPNDIHYFRYIDNILIIYRKEHNIPQMT